jgi:hypothetical protein
MMVKHNNHVLTAAYHRINILMRQLRLREIPVTVFNFYMDEVIRMLKQEDIE